MELEKRGPICELEVQSSISQGVAIYVREPVTIRSVNELPPTPAPSIELCGDPESTSVFPQWHLQHAAVGPTTSSCRCWTNYIVMSLS